MRKSKYKYSHWVYAIKRPSTAKAFTYKIWFPLLDLRYIGYKTIDKNNSWLSYKSSSKEVKKLINAGHKAIYRIVNWFDNAVDARKEEIAAMTYYDVTHRSEYLNQCIGGVKFGGSKKHTAETKAKIGAANKGRKLPPISAETRAKMSVASTGRTKSTETRAKIGAVHKGKIISAETRAKLREANIGKNHLDETRSKISESNKGRTKSDEHKSKLSVAHQIGLYVTPLGTFKSRIDASVANSCAIQTIYNRCKSTSPKFNDWSFIPNKDR